MLARVRISWRLGKSVVKGQDVVRFFFFFFWKCKILEGGGWVSLYFAFAFLFARSFVRLFIRLFQKCFFFFVEFVEVCWLLFYDMFIFFALLPCLLVVMMMLCFLSSFFLR